MAAILGNVRKAYASRGDDATLSRFVKMPGRHSRGIIVKAKEGATGTSFPKTVKAARDVKNLLVSGHNSVKLGRDVRKGHLKGYWIYSLSLEERATCPSSCQHWRTCYGNNMPLAKRITPDNTLLHRLEQEIRRYTKNPRRRGLLIRLHALGDFYSLEYVDFWGAMLRTYRNMSIFGYTAHQEGTEIGDALARLNKLFPQRFWLRFSDGGKTTNCTVSIKKEAERPASSFICPEQTGKTTCCATCGACWATRKNVAFLAH